MVKRWMALIMILSISLPLIVPVSADSGTPSLRSVAQERNISIGTAINMGALNKDKEYTDRLKKEFNILTAENSMKFSQTEPDQGRFNFKDSDRIVKLAKENDMSVRGHTLVWHNSVPKWLTDHTFSREEMIDILHNHIQEVVGHFAGDVSGWDVVNEAFNDDGSLRQTLWYKSIGPEYIDMAFRWAHEADPDVLLFYNDYGIEEMNAKSNAVYRMIRQMQEDGVPIHGVGFQSHFKVSNPPDFRLMDLNMKRFAELGLQTDITELDVSTAGAIVNLETIDEQQAKIYRQTLNTCLHHTSCKALVMWGFTDAYTWKRDSNKQDSPTIMDEQYRPKQAYNALYKSLLSGYAPTGSLLQVDDAATRDYMIEKTSLLAPYAYRNPNWIAKNISAQGAAAGPNTDWEQGKASKWFIEEQRYGEDAVIGGIVKNDLQAINTGLRMFDWGFQNQSKDGSFSSSSDLFHSTSFFVSAVAHSILMLQQSQYAELYKERIAGYIPKLRLAAQWMIQPQVWEKGIKGNNPYTHRTYLVGSALGLSARLTGDEAVFQKSKEIIRDGLDLQWDNGVNPEKEGYDSSYQAVGIVYAERWLAYYPDDELRPELERMIIKALEWEASRVAEDGTLMDGGNSRTAGQEKTRSSVVKTVSYGSAVRAFTYWAEFTNAPEYHEIARRLNNHPVNK